MRPGRTDPPIVFPPQSSICAFRSKNTDIAINCMATSYVMTSRQKCGKFYHPGFLWWDAGKGAADLAMGCHNHHKHILIRRYHEACICIVISRSFNSSFTAILTIISACYGRNIFSVVNITTVISALWWISPPFTWDLGRHFWHVSVKRKNGRHISGHPHSQATVWTAKQRYRTRVPSGGELH
jgi:hypothetical protein